MRANITWALYLLGPDSLLTGYTFVLIFFQWVVSMRVDTAWAISAGPGQPADWILIQIDCIKDY
jgi:hypothetical protein